MSAWHRDNPELVGTNADPWMAHDSYRRATGSPYPLRRLPSYRELERISAARCYDPDCRHVQPHGPRCIACGGRLGDNEPC